MTALTTIGAERTTTDWRSPPIRFVELDGGCFVPLSHKLNQDGYFRKAWTTSTGKVTEMFHRFIYRAHKDLAEIPKGFEIDHVCGERGCCNPKHLRLLSRKDHLSLTNRLRYQEIHEAARLTWEAHGKPDTLTLSKMLGRDHPTVKRWHAQWVAEDEAWEVEKANMVQQ